MGPLRRRLGEPSTQPSRSRSTFLTVHVRLVPHRKARHARRRGDDLPAVSIEKPVGIYKTFPDKYL